MPGTSLLLIDDDEVDRLAVVRALEALAGEYEMEMALDGRQGLELAAAGRFECILLDYQLPDINGLDLLVQLRERLAVAAAIVMLTGAGNESIAVEAMKRGAHDYLPKAKLGPESLERVVANAMEKDLLQRRLAEAQRKLEGLALFDTLTGLGNRNLFHIELARAVAIARRKKTSFFLLMMDLDKFKMANDTFGHEAGDAILAAVGARLREGARAADAYFRVGGDEFIAILDAGSDGEAASSRIIAALARPVAFGAHVLRVTASVGLAAFPADAGCAQDLIRAADLAMYNAKGARRGREPDAGATAPRRAFA
jgi:diguanylate cyclase (GGDEF)-like protein